MQDTLGSIRANATAIQSSGAEMRRSADDLSRRTESQAASLEQTAAAVDEITLDGERVVPQPGGFYGGWITADVVGPFKGGPGSWGW